jgi:hypothetical protein
MTFSKKVMDITVIEFSLIVFRIAVVYPNPKRMFGKYKQALVKKKLPRLVRLDKIQNPNSHQGSHDSSLHHRINMGTV